MVKQLFLLACLCVGFSNIATAQQFKHLQLKINDGGNWRLYSKGRPTSGVNKMRADPKKHIMTLIFNAIHSFPEEIKKELIKYDGRISVGFDFNAKGEIFYVYFLGRGNIKDGIPLTEKQWLEIVQIIKRIKIDLTQIDVLDELEWGAGGIYHITNILRNEVDIHGMVKRRRDVK